MTNAELVSRWSDRLAAAKKWRESVMVRERWESYLREFDGNFNDVIGMGKDVPPINDVYAYTQSAQSAFYNRDPYITVNPTRKSSIMGAVILEAAVNYYWRKLDIKSAVQSEIQDCILIGHAWNKTGYNVELSGDGSQLQVKSDTLFSNRVSWRDIYFNIGSMNPPYDSSWVMHRIYLPLDTVKKRYGSKAKDLHGSSLPDFTKEMKESVIYKDDIQFVSLYEIWDASERMIYLYCDENQTFMDNARPWPEYMRSYPFQMLAFNRINDKPYPKSDIAPWEPQLLEKIKLQWLMLNHMKRWSRTMVGKKGALSPSEQTKFAQGIDGTYLESSASDIQTAFRTLDYGSLPPDIYAVLDRIEGVIRSVSGQPEFDRGGSTQARTRTLGELELIQSGSQTRTDRKTDLIETHCEEIARHMIAHMQAQFYVPQIVKITGREPQEVIAAFGNKFDPLSQTIEFSKEDIMGEYDINVKSGSTLPLNKKTRDQMLQKVLELAAPFAQAASIPPFIAVTMKEILKGYDIQSLEAAFDAQMQEMQQQQQAQAQDGNVQVDKTKAETRKRDAQSAQIEQNVQVKELELMGKAGGHVPMETSL